MVMEQAEKIDYQANEIKVNYKKISDALQEKVDFLKQ